MTTTLAATLLETITYRLRKVADQHERDGDAVRSNAVRAVLAQAIDIPTGFATRFESIHRDSPGDWLRAVADTSRAITGYMTFQQFLEKLDSDLKAVAA